MTEPLLEPCLGCGARLPRERGPVHRYMTSSPACWRRFGAHLAHEYSDPELLAIHRLSVDAYAVQHPGDGSRRAIQSVGLHLARLMLQLESPRTPRETNDIMLGMTARKHTLERLAPPARFGLTIADVAPFSGTELHTAKVRAWAERAWTDWHAHHAYIAAWVAAG